MVWLVNPMFPWLILRGQRTNTKKTYHEKDSVVKRLKNALTTSLVLTKGSHGNSRFHRGLFVDVQNKTGTMEELMTRKIHVEELHNVVMKYVFDNLGIINCQSFGLNQKDNKNIWKFGCGQCHCNYKSGRCKEEQMTICFTQADDNEKNFVYNDSDQLHNSCWKHYPNKKSHYGFCVPERKLDSFFILNDSRFHKLFHKTFGTDPVDASRRTKSMKSVNEFF